MADIRQALYAVLMRQAGDNRQLADEVMEKLLPSSQRRLYRILNEFESQVNDAAHQELRRQGESNW